MTWLLESPVPLWLVGAVALTFTGVLYHQTASRESALALVAILALLVGGTLLERVVETPREQVERTLSELHAAVEANDLNAVHAMLAPEAFELRTLADRVMPQLNVLKARVLSEVRPTFDDAGNPVEATVEFRGFYQANTKRTGLQGGRPFTITTTLRRDGERWLLVDYESNEGIGAEADRLLGRRP